MMGECYHRMHRKTMKRQIVARRRRRPRAKMLDEIKALLHSDEHCFVGRYSMKVELIMGLCLLLCAGLTACGGGDNAKNARRPAPVRAALVQRQDMPRMLMSVGKAQASATVEVRPRVTGEIMEVRFTEGADVRAGQPLLLIDPRPYEALLGEEQGKLAQAEAQLSKARRDMARYAKLAGEGYVSRDAGEQAATAAATAAAAVRTSRAAVEKAALDVGYCSISAPISGRAGELTIHKGNVVKTTETTMLRIDTISPSYVSFAVPERYLPAVLEQMRAGELPVEATPRGGKAVQGQVSLVDSTVDVATGTIRLRATFANEDRSLWPGQFVEVRLLLGTEQQALTVPATALMDGSEGRYVYVVQEGKAQQRAVQVLFTSGDSAVLDSGVKEGEHVVTEGQMRLTSGMPVEMKK